MSLKTNGDAADIIENEGVGYAVADYCDGDEFDDPVTKHLWNAAGQAIEGLRAHLSRQTGRSIT